MGNIDCANCDSVEKSRTENTSYMETTQRVRIEYKRETKRVCEKEKEGLTKGERESRRVRDMERKLDRERK